MLRLTSPRLSQDLLLISGAGGNVVLAIRPEGLAMVDGGLPEKSGDLLNPCESRRPWLIPCRSFSTRTGIWITPGQTRFSERRASKIVAHANTAKWLKTRVFVEAENRMYGRRPPEAIPTETFTNPQR